MTSHRRLRLGVDFHEWDGIFQGSRSHVLGLYRQAIRQAPDIDFVFLLSDTASLKAAHEEFRLPNVSMVHMPASHGLVRLGLRLPWLRWRHRLDVLHTQYRVPFWGGGSLVCTIHDVLFETCPQFFSPGFIREARFTFRMAARRADALLTVSRYSKSELERLYKVPPAKLAVTYNGVDRQRFFPGSEGEDQVRALGLTPGGYVLIVGRLEPRKNHLALIEVMARLGADAPPLVIVGQEDPGFPQVRHAIDDMARQHKVFQFKQLGDGELPAVMRHAAVFVYPAFAEGFGMPVAEAMASGVPVLTSNTTSLPEVAGDGALLFDPHDKDDLYRALRQALSLDAPARQALIERGLAQVRQFDWGLSAQVLLGQVRKLAEDKVGKR